MRGKAAGMGILVALAMAAPAQAGALDARVAAGPGGASAGYLTPQTAITKGGTLSFLNLDIVSHDVVSTRRGYNGAPLFKSPLIGLGKRAAVTGVNKLPKGAYGFFCSLHPNMKGTLRVL